MAKPTDYSALVADAEKAVQSVKDPELKRIAFQKVLDDLLSSGGGGSSKEPTRGAPKRTKSSSAQRARIHSGDAWRRLFQETQDDYRRKS